jgi:hypothetical protein
MVLANRCYCEGSLRLALTLLKPRVRIVGEMDKGESGPFPGAVYELRVIRPRYLKLQPRRPR